MTLDEAEEKLLQILKQVMEEKLTSTNVEVCYTCDDNIGVVHEGIVFIIIVDDLHQDWRNIQALYKGAIRRNFGKNQVIESQTTCSTLTLY